MESRMEKNQIQKEIKRLHQLRFMIKVTIDEVFEDLGGDRKIENCRWINYDIID